MQKKMCEILTNSDSVGAYVSACLKIFVDGLS